MICLICPHLPFGSCIHIRQINLAKITYIMCNALNCLLCDLRIFSCCTTIVTSASYFIIQCLVINISPKQPLWNIQIWVVSENASGVFHIGHHANCNGNYKNCKDHLHLSYLKYSQYFAYISLIIELVIKNITPMMRESINERPCASLLNCVQKWLLLHTYVCLTHYVIYVQLFSLK